MEWDDGYTEELNSEIRFRRLLKPERALVTSWIRNKRADKAEEYLFRSPYLFSDIPLSELTELHKTQLFTHWMSNPTEDQDHENLIWGTKLYSTNPRLSARSCVLCKKWLFDEETGLVRKVGNSYRPRPKQMPPICDTTSQMKCPRGHHSNPKVMSSRNKQALSHYMEYEGVGCPHSECPIMRRNWRAIKWIFEKHGHPAIHE